jgi:hypothetical protein
MSRPPRATREPGDNRRDLLWSALIIVAAVVGGLAAAAITNESTRVSVAVSVLIAAVVVLALYQGVFDRRQGAGRRRAGAGPGPGGPGPGPGPGGSGPKGPAVARAPAADATGAERFGAETRPPGQHDGQPPVPGAPVQPGVVRLIQQPPPAGSAWWEEHQAGTPDRRAARPAPPRQVALSQFLDQTLIAQCPNCGAFRIDVDNRAPEWLFRCLECGQRWTWQPGQPWPPIEVRPNARGRTDRPRG